MQVAALDDSEPTPLPHALIFWNAFTTLADRRIVNDSGVPQPIQYSEILSWLKCHGLDSDVELAADTAHFVTLLDRQYLDHAHGLITKARRDAQKRAKAQANQRHRK